MRQLTRLPTKVERVMATGFVMVLCLLVYRLAEQRLRQRLGETGAAVPDQRKQAYEATHHAVGVSVFRGR